jgi:tripartite motif-containing protein 71
LRINGFEGSDDVEFTSPRNIAVLGSSGEVAVADFHNHRVQIFDSEGNYKRQFSTYGTETASLTGLQASHQMHTVTCS